jgi:hypothetical protein
MNSCGRTPLSWVASNEGEAAVMPLLNQGAELESKDTLRYHGL